MSKNSFIGTWKLISCELKTKAGDVTYPFGINPAGYIMYNPDGYMAVAIMNADRPKFAIDDHFGGTLEEKGRAFETYYSYTGKYEIFAADNKIIHHPEVNTNPNFVNVPQERYFEFVGDNQLILGAYASQADGEEQSSRLVWQRAY
ncbi:MAG: lipocalin-like domain-containing protein [Gammaproteobacteria bacterium]|nr:lipocalin-like domain-containing protein [Gammaproteobacteria bacterium]